jgi:hypothetical protein
LGSVSQDEYRRRALECIAVARSLKDPSHAALLLGMAQAGLRLADYAAMYDTAAVIGLNEPREEER